MSTASIKAYLDCKKSIGNNDIYLSNETLKYIGYYDKKVNSIHHLCELKTIEQDTFFLSSTTFEEIRRFKKQCKEGETFKDNEDFAGYADVYHKNYKNNLLQILEPLYERDLIAAKTKTDLIKKVNKI